MTENRKNSFKWGYLIIIPAICLLGSIACTHQKKVDPESIVIAKIGGEEISVHDFRLDYEFGFSQLKTGQNRKLNYLEKMINEKLLSLQGYELGLDKSERVQRLVKELQEELVIEQVFIDNINSKVVISDQEIREAINKSKVNWKFRYWVEPEKEFASSVCAHMRQYGYAATVEKILSSNPETTLKPSDFETSYLTWLDVSPELLSVIQNLELGAISDPIEMGEEFYIFQLLDIRREPVTEYDYKSRAESYRKILRARKEQELYEKFVSSFMTPKNVVTKGDVFAVLSQNLYEWYKNKKDIEDLNAAIANAKDDRPYLVNIRQILNKVLVTFRDGEWTVDDFLKIYHPKSIKWTENDDLGTLQNKFNAQIASAVRDYFLFQKGYKEKATRRPEVKDEIKRWQDKWVYQELRAKIASNIDVSDEEAKKYFVKFNNRFKVRSDDKPTFESNIKSARLYAAHQKELELINSELQKLRMNYGVVINHAVLDTMIMIESQKSRGISVQVYKRSSQRMAYPVVDPSWGF